MSATPINAALGGGDRLHFCLLDHALNPISASHGLCPDDGSQLPEHIHHAYGVAPHPDMPDGIFVRMVMRLKDYAGSAGYFMCQSRTGDVVWIAVSLYRTDGGFIACHFQVTVPDLALIGKFFASLKQSEDDGLDPETIAIRLGELCVAERIQDYPTVATNIMVQEIVKRAEGTNRAQFTQLKALAFMLATLQSIEQIGKDIDAVSQRSKMIPYQLKLLAARHEGRHGPIKVIAENHQELTDRLVEVTTEIRVASVTEIDPVKNAIAFLAQSNHAAELIENSRFANHETDSLPDAIKCRLIGVIEDCAAQVTKTLTNIDNSVLALGKICRRMHRALSAMELTRVMCKIESAAVDPRAKDAGFAEIDHQLNQVQRKLIALMWDIDDASTKTRALVEQLNKDAAENRADTMHAPGSDHWRALLNAAQPV